MIMNTNKDKSVNMIKIERSDDDEEYNEDDERDNEVHDSNWNGDGYGVTL